MLGTRVSAVCDCDDSEESGKEGRGSKHSFEKALLPSVCWEQSSTMKVKLLLFPQMNPFSSWTHTHAVCLLVLGGESAFTQVSSNHGLRALHQNKNRRARLQPGGLSFGKRWCHCLISVGGEKNTLCPLFTHTAYLQKKKNLQYKCLWTCGNPLWI